MFWVLLAGGIALLAVLIYIFYQYYSLRQQIKSNPGLADKAAVEQAKKLADEVGKLVFLPTDEIPTVATVTDITKLKAQVFFKGAKNGDKVLIYAKAKKAILYDPILNKIIEIGPVNMGTSIPNTPASAVSKFKPKVIIRNGTDIAGLAKRTETEINKSFPNIIVSNVEQAQGSNYDKTIVVVLTKAAKDAGADLAKFLKAAVTNLPDKESTPAAGIDLLIIAGKDRPS